MSMDIIRAIRLVSSVNACEEYLAEAIDYLEEFERRVSSLEERQAYDDEVRRERTW